MGLLGTAIKAGLTGGASLGQDLGSAVSNYAQNRIDKNINRLTDPMESIQSAVDDPESALRDRFGNVKQTAPVTQTITTKPDGSQTMTVRGTPQDLSAAVPGTPTVTQPGMDNLATPVAAPAATATSQPVAAPVSPEAQAQPVTGQQLQRPETWSDITPGASVRTQANPEGAVPAEPQPEAQAAVAPAAPAPAQPPRVAKPQTYGRGNGSAASVNNPSGLGARQDGSGQYVWRSYDTPQEGVADTQNLVDGYLKNPGRNTPESFVGTWVTGDARQGASVQGGAYVNSLRKNLAEAGVELNPDGSIPNTKAANDAITRAIIVHESGPKNAANFLPHVGSDFQTTEAGASGVRAIPASLAAPTMQVQPARDNSIEEYHRVGRDFFAASVKQFGGDTVAAVASMHSDPQTVQNAIDRARKDGVTDYRPYLPKATQEYIRNISPDRPGVPLAGGSPEETEAILKAAPPGSPGHFYLKNQNDPVAMTAMAHDPKMPPGMRQAAADQAHRLAVNSQKERYSEVEFQKIMQDGGKGLQSAVNDKSPDGSYLKAYIFKRLGLTDLAAAEQKKLGAGNHWQQSMIDGKPAYVYFDGEGKPVKGYNAEGQLNDKQLVDSTSMKGVVTHTGKMRDRTTGEIYYEQTGPQGIRLVNNKGQAFTGDSKNLFAYGIGSDVEQKNQIQINALANKLAYAPVTAKATEIAKWEALNGPLDPTVKERIMSAPSGVPMAVEGATGTPSRTGITGTTGTTAPAQAAPAQAAPAQAAPAQAAPAGAVAPQQAAPAQGTTTPAAPAAGAVAPTEAPATTARSTPPAEAPAPTPAQTVAATGVVPMNPAQAASAIPNARPQLPPIDRTNKTPAQIKQLEDEREKLQRSQLNVSEDEQKKFNKVKEDIAESTGTAQRISNISGSQLADLLDDPKVIGYLANETSGGQIGKLVRDIFSGSYGPDPDGKRKELSDRIVQVKDPALRSKLEHYVQLSTDINQLTLKANSGPGSITDFENRNNQKSNMVNIGDLTAWSLLNGITRRKFVGDLALAKQDFLANYKGDPTSTAFTQQWNRYNGQLMRQYEGLYRSRLEYIKPFYEAASANPNDIQAAQAYKSASVHSFRKFPTPDFKEGTWQFKTQNSRDAFMRGITGD